MTTVLERVRDTVGGARPGRAFLVALHLPYLLAVAAFTILRRQLGLGESVVVVLLLLVIGGLQLRHSIAATRGERPRGWPVSFLALAAAVYAPIPSYTWDWAPAQWFLIASAAMVLPRALAWPAVVGPIVGTAAVSWNVIAAEADAREAALFVSYITAVLIMGAVALYASARLVGVIEELSATRSALARVAIDRERLRISRDLHDILGSSLSAVSLKGDLAVRLLETDPPTARSEIESLTEVARSALRDIQAVARDQHAVSLEREIDAAAALLRAAGVVVVVDVQLPALHRQVEEVIAWAVREGTTNILRHSDARGGSITAFREGSAVHLEVTNDGARGPQAAGTGLAGLRERAERLSGSVVSGYVDNERFRLMVELPEGTA